MTNRKSPLVAMSIYAKEHSLSYQEVSDLLASGKLTYEDIGAENPVKAAAKSEPIFQEQTEETENAKCLFCGKKMTQQITGQRYCSPECADKAKEAIKAAKEDNRKQRRDKIFNLRGKGSTTTQIAKECGCSPSWVSETLRKGKYYVNAEGKYYMPPIGCIYKPLKEWMLNNRMGYRDLFEQSHLWADVGAVRRRLQGTSRLDKDDIDEILRITSCTYEQLFSEKR